MSRRKPMREFKGVRKIAGQLVHVIEVFREQNDHIPTRQQALKELAIADGAYAAAQRRVRELPRSEFDAAVTSAATIADVLMFAPGDEMQLPDEDDIYVPEDLR